MVRSVISGAGEPPMAPRTAASMLDGESDRGSPSADAWDRAAGGAGAAGAATGAALGGRVVRAVFDARAAGTLGALGTRAFAIDSAVGVLARRGGIVRRFDFARAISSSTSLVMVTCSPRTVGGASPLGAAPAAAVARANASTSNGGLIVGLSLSRERPFSGAAGLLLGALRCGGVVGMGATGGAWFLRRRVSASWPRRL
jgi:hypothetical protein